MKPETPFEKAELALGSKSAIARACGVSYQAVQFWEKKGIPPKHCRTIEEATHGQVTRQELRPDIFGEARA